MNDVTMAALQTMLRGLSARQQAIADNIANVETPGYLAKRVEFEDSLREAIASGGRADLQPNWSSSTDEVLPNGNNVVIEQEMVTMQETQLRYELAIQAMNSKLSLLRTSIGSR
jgi:flagellar basal-body rod protein FlgB